MNKDQRKALVEAVTETYKSDRKRIEDELPEEPTLNHHVMGAILTGTLKILPEAEIQKRLLQRARTMRKDEKLIDTESEWGYSMKRAKSISHTFSVTPETIIEFPESYLEERKKYDAKKEEVNAKLRDLDIQYKTVKLKVEVGSPEHLQKLVMQIDQLGSLDLINNRLLLGGDSASIQKALGTGEEKS